MALHSISGGATVVYENGIVPNIYNNAGSVRLGGAISSDNSGVGADWNPMRLGDDNYQNNNTLAVSGVGGADIIIHAGNFNAGTQVIRMVNTGIAGVSNTTFQFTASNAQNRSNSIKDMQVMRVLANNSGIRSNQWDRFRATWDAGAPQNVTSGIWNQNTDANDGGAAGATDDAANPTRTTPGEYVFLVGKTITSGNYDAKNG